MENKLIESKHIPGFQTHPYIEQFIDQVSEMGGLEVIRWVVENNAAKDLPYHNTQHLLGVASITNEILLNNNESNRFTFEDRVIAIVAALFHDFSHSGLNISDASNIRVANAHFGTFVSCQLANAIDYGPEWIMSRAKELRVKNIVSETIFPRQRKFDTSTLIGGLVGAVSDADYLYSLRSEGIPYAAIGLHQEINNAKLALNLAPLSKQQWLDHQKSFFRNMADLSWPSSKEEWDFSYPDTLDKMTRLILE